MTIRIGTAGWNLRKEVGEHFRLEGTHLERYASVFNSVEINSSFYKPHRRSTYQRWAATTPHDFRFAVKIPRQITHDMRLIGVDAELEQFLVECGGLDRKLGVLLVQLPPSLKFDLQLAKSFFGLLRTRITVPVVCEPRHASWFSDDVEVLLKNYQTGRVAADPRVAANAAIPAGAAHIRYFRWHGSPRIYYSTYDDAALHELARQLLASSQDVQETWCLFDNTAEGAALQNALALKEILVSEASTATRVAP